MQNESRKKNWQQIWISAGIPNKHEEIFELLLASYQQSHRKYHTLAHLDECLSLFEKVAEQFEAPIVSASALWFHDSVYETSRDDNEEKSAQLALKCLSATELEPERTLRVACLIRATSHQFYVNDNDAVLLADIDLAILGCAPERFLEYCDQIREEYAHVPDDVFHPTRRGVLASFKERPMIYRTAFFMDKFEHQARCNLNNWLDNKKPSDEGFCRCV